MEILAVRAGALRPVSLQAADLDRALATGDIPFSRVVADLAASASAFAILWTRPAERSATADMQA